MSDLGDDPEEGEDPAAPDQEGEEVDGPQSGLQLRSLRVVLRVLALTSVIILAFSLIIWALGNLHLDNPIPGFPFVLFILVANTTLGIYLAWKEERSLHAALTNPPRCLALRPRVLKPVLKKLARLFLLEVFLVNIGLVIWAVGIGSFFGQFSFGYSFELAFFIAFVGLLGHYSLFFRFYLRRRPILLWQWFDLLLAIAPISLTVLAFLVFILGGYVAFWLVTNRVPPIVGATTWTVLLFSLVVVAFVPFLVWWVVVRPRQMAARVWGRHRQARAGSIMRAAIASQCEGRRIDRNTVETLELVKNRIDVVDGLATLPRLRRLVLDRNVLVCLEGVVQLECLVHVSVQWNLIGRYEGLVPLRRLPNLAELLLHGNPLKSRLDRLVALLPHVKVIDGHSVTRDEREQAVADHARWVIRILASGTKDRWSGLAESAMEVDDLRSALICRQRGDVLDAQWGRGVASFQEYGCLDSALLLRIDHERRRRDPRSVGLGGVMLASVLSASVQFEFDDGPDDDAGSVEMLEFGD